MRDPALSAAPKRKHREIDSGIETSLGKLDCGSVQLEPLIAALEALRRHIYPEGVFLFPPIRETGMVRPIFVMMREHGDLWHVIDTLTTLLDDGKDSAGLHAACLRLLDLLGEHNSKEEPIIYPHADPDLPPQTSTELARFIRTGRTPDGWVCQQAGQ